MDSAIVSLLQAYSDASVSLVSSIFTTIQHRILLHGYASIKAIESPSKEDDQQWLSYWIIYSFVALLELAAAPIFAWIPLWSTIKLACACWLVLPPFNGAAYIYDVFVRGKLLQYQERMGKNLSQSQQKILHLMSPGNQRSVEHFISERGPDEFDRVIAEAFRSSNKRHEY